MGDQTIGRYNPAYNQLVTLKTECQQKDAPDYVLEGINKALELIEARDLYCEEISSKPSEALATIASETKTHPWKEIYDQGTTKSNLHPTMLTAALEGQFLRTLVSMNKAKRVLELGMYTGYSALACAEVLPEDGEVVTCEMEPYLENVAKGFFANSPHGKKINIRIGQAKDTLLQLAQEKQGFDIVFIDSDKPGYKEYYQIIMDKGMLNKGGTIMFDNAMFYGQAYAKDCSPEKYPNGWGVNQSNAFVAADTRVERVLVPIRDGVLIVRRKEDM